jgi:hypothetical protein
MCQPAASRRPGLEEYNGDCGERCEFRLLRKSATQSGGCYSHGEYRHCTAVTSSLTAGPGEGSADGVGCGEGTDSAATMGEEGSGSAVTTGRGVGTGTAASARRGECAGTVALTFQQLFIVMQNGEPEASDGLIIIVTAKIRIMRSLIRAKSSNSDTSHPAMTEERPYDRTCPTYFSFRQSTLEMYRASPKNHQSPEVDSQFFPDGKVSFRPRLVHYKRFACRRLGLSRN